MTLNFQRLTAAVSGTIATIPSWPATVSRWINIVSNRIPDISRIPAKKRVSLGVAISLLIHLVLILISALIFGGQMERIDFAKPKPKPRSIELTVVEPEPEPMMPFTLQPKQEMPFIDSRGLDIGRDPALNPIFQADENMKAASELPATGDAPLPSQEGRDRPFNAFKTQRSLLGSSSPQPFPPAEPAPPLAAPQTPPPQPIPPQVAQQQPPKTTPPDPDEKKTDTKPEEPAETVPMKLAQPPRTDALAMRTSQSKRDVRKDVLPPPETKPAATPAPPEQQAMLTTPPPRPQAPPRESGFQPEQEMNRIEGNISNRGRKSVDAVATPLAKYRKQVNDAIGSRWYFYVKDPQRMSLIAPGSARVSFFIDGQGQIVGIKLESNSSNESFAELCTSAVRDAREQIKDLKFPVDAALPLKDGRLEYSLTFTFYNL